MTALTAGRQAWSGLSDRDWNVLHDLARVRLLTGRHVQRLHVHEGSPLTQARRTRSLLQRLNDVGLVSRLDRRIGGVYAGSSGFVYGLSSGGQRLTTGAGPAGGRRLRRPWEPSSSFTDHVLAVSELYVGLREHQRAGGCDVVDFDAEPACWRWWSGLSGERLVLKPDAYAEVAVDDAEHRSFVEVDRCTESSRVLRRKAEAYVTYYDSGTEQRRTGMFPRVCFVVPDHKRYEQVVDAISHVSAERWRLFRVVVASEAVVALCGGTS